MALLEKEILNPFSRECVKTFISDWKTVKGSFYDKGLHSNGLESDHRRSAITVTLKGQQGSYSPVALKGQQGSYSPAPSPLAIPPLLIKENSQHTSSVDPSPSGNEIIIIEPDCSESTEEATLHVKQAIKQNLPMHIFKSMKENLTGDLRSANNSSPHLPTFRKGLESMEPPPSNRR